MGLFTKFFGEKASSKEARTLVDEVLKGMVEKAGLEISWNIEVMNDEDSQILKTDFFGEDEKLFTTKDGNLLDAFQLFLRRVLQHRFTGEDINIICDCGDFRSRINRSLEELANRLKEKAIDQDRPVYFRALSPKDRKVVHQFLAKDERVKSRSVGEGLYKKIRIYPSAGEKEFSGRDDRSKR